MEREAGMAPNAPPQRLQGQLPAQESTTVTALLASLHANMAQMQQLQDALALQTTPEVAAAAATAAQAAAARSTLVGSTARSPVNVRPVAAAQQDSSHAPLGSAGSAAGAELSGLDRDMDVAQAQSADQTAQPARVEGVPEEWQVQQLKYMQRRRQMDPTHTNAYSRPRSAEVPAGQHGECITVFKTFAPQVEDQSRKKLEEKPDEAFGLLQPPPDWGP